MDCGRLSRIIVTLFMQSSNNNIRRHSDFILSTQPMAENFEPLNNVNISLSVNSYGKFFFVCNKYNGSITCPGRLFNNIIGTGKKNFRDFISFNFNICDLSHGLYQHTFSLVNFG